MTKGGRSDGSSTYELARDASHAKCSNVLAYVFIGGDCAQIWYFIRIRKVCRSSDWAWIHSLSLSRLSEHLVCCFVCDELSGCALRLTCSTTARRVSSESMMRNQLLINGFSAMITGACGMWVPETFTGLWLCASTDKRMRYLTNECGDFAWRAMLSCIDFSKI